MARFNLDDYETVEERIKKLYQAHEDARITTECVVAGQDGKWLFKAYLYLTAGDQANGLAKATGYASETEGGPQSDWKAELGETSAIGRCLANAGFSGNRRSSREEIQKVMRADEVADVLKAKRDWLADAKATTDVDKLRHLYVQAKADRAPNDVLKEIEKMAKAK